LSTTIFFQKRILPIEKEDSDDESEYKDTDKSSLDIYAVNQEFVDSHLSKDNFKPVRQYFESDIIRMQTWLKDQKEIFPIPTRTYCSLLLLDSATKQQRKIYESLSQHLKTSIEGQSNTQLFIQVLGAAGTGKSFAIDLIASRFKEHFLSSTTGRADLVIIFTS